jgi:hypothetical protein
MRAKFSQAKSESSQAGAESSKIQPSLAKETPLIFLDSLRRIESFQTLAQTPRAKNLLGPLAPDKSAFNMGYNPRARRPSVRTL